MTDIEVEEQLAEEIKAETPDILDSLMKEISAADLLPIKTSSDDQKKADQDLDLTAADEPTAETAALEQNREKVQIVKPADRAKNGRLLFYRMFAGIAAALVIFIGAGVLMNEQRRTVAVVGLDVNPSIELSVNKSEHVVGADALNEDAEKMLAGMDLKGSDVNTACDALIGAMIMNGYLTKDSNSMLVSVRSNDPLTGRKLEKSVSERLSRFVENYEVAAAIMGQYVEDDDQVAEVAERNGISKGKAWLIMKLLDSGSKHFTEDSLSRLTTQELILLGQNRDAFTEEQHGEASTSKYVGEKKATNAALKHAGIKRADAAGIICEFDCDDGMIIYDVEFTAGGLEYEYDIDAVTGKVIKSEKEAAEGSWSGSGSGYTDDDDRYDDDDDRDDDDDDRDDDDDDRDDDDDDRDDDDDDRDDDD